MDGSVTYDIVTMSLSCTASEINGRTLQNFPSDPVLTPWLREFPLEFCNSGSTPNLGSCPYLKAESVR